MEYRIRQGLINYENKTYLRDDIIPDDAINCSLGINPFGFTSQITKDVFNSTFNGISEYPSYPYVDLKQTICNYLSGVANLMPEQIQLDNGSLAVLINLNRLLINPGSKVLCLAPTFTAATADMEAMGATIDSVFLNETDQFKINLDQLKERLEPDHTVIYLDNPNNPTGQMIPLQELKELAHLAEKQNTMIIIDEAYGDFIDLSHSAASLIEDHPNIIVVRSLSKGFGLAGLRAGYSIVHKDFIPYIKKLPSEMALTEITAQLAPYALQDTQFLERSRQKIAENKKKLLSELNVLKWGTTFESVPIVLLYTDRNVHLFELLLKHGIITTNGEDFEGLDRHYVRLRVPKDIKPLLKRLQLVEEELASHFVEFI